MCVPKWAVVVVAVVATASAAWVHVARRGDGRRSSSVPPSPDTAQVVFGTVLGPAGGVPQAIVRLQGDDHSVSSDQQGRFVLPVKPGATRMATSAPGYYITTCALDTGPMQVTLEPLPSRDDPSYAWVDPGPDSSSRQRCVECHKRIYAEWSESAHARSAMNPRLRDLVNGTDSEGNPNAGWSLRRDHPHGVAVCNACHAPTLEPDDPGWESLGDARESARLGVHCDFCHKVESVDTSNVGLTHGRYAMLMRRPGPERQLFFGPHDDAARSDNAFSPVYRSSEYCASCHEGTIFGQKVYTTYSEWLVSPAGRQGRQCQNCHMAPADNITNMVAEHGGVARRASTLSSHSFDGASAARYRDALAVSLETHESTVGIEAAITIDASEIGHFAPTGFVDRHLILLVESYDSEGIEVAIVKGPHIPDCAGDDVAGRCGELFARVLEDAAGNSPAPFWSAVAERSDTRIDPACPRVLHITLARAVRRLRIRLLHRDFWEEVRELKRWPDETVVVLDCTCDTPGPPRRLRQ